MNYFNLERKELLKYLPNNLNILLDVGCGEGKFGTAVKKKKDCIVFGIEPNAQAAHIAAKSLDHVENASFETAIKNINQKFDLIAFNDVLEHMIDPWASLELAKDYLNDNGHIFMSLPNFLHFYNILEILKTKDWKYKDKGILDKTHLRFFTKKSIARFLEESGYTVELIEGINPIKSRGFFVLNILTFGYYYETKYPQFVVLARPTC